MNTRSATDSKLKVLTAAVLAMLVALAMASFAAERAWADDRPDGSVVVKNSSGTFTFDYWLYDGKPASIQLSGYEGTATEIALPNSFEATFGEQKFSIPSDGGELIVGKAFANNTTVKKISIPDGYEFITDHAFTGCASLTEVSIGSTISYFGQDAFAGLENVTYRIAASGAGLSYSGIGESSSDGNPRSILATTIYAIPDSDAYKYFDDMKKNRQDGDKIALNGDANPYPDHAGAVAATEGNASGNNGNAGGNSNDGNSNDGNSNDGNSNGKTPLTVDPLTEKGEDKTGLSKGASVEAAEAALAKHGGKEADPAGTTFCLLQAKLTAPSQKSVKLTWKNNVPGAKKYIIYGNVCGLKNKMVKQAVITNAKAKSKAFKKVKNNKGKAVKVKKGTYYKFTVIALDANNKVIATSKMVHAATPGGKVGNDKKVTTTVKKGKLSIKKGKKVTFTAKVTPANKKLTVKRHRAVAFESSDKSIATVKNKGKNKCQVTAKKKKGTCYIYAYAQNGVFAKVKVTVK